MYTNIKKVSILYTLIDLDSILTICIIYEITVLIKLITALIKVLLVNK